jgi:hypothetical protein
MVSTIIALTEAISGSLGAFFLAVGGITIAAADLYRHFRTH